MAKSKYAEAINQLKALAEVKYNAAEAYKIALTQQAEELGVTKPALNKVVTALQRDRAVKAMREASDTFDMFEDQGVMIEQEEPKKPGRRLRAIG